MARPKLNIDPKKVKQLAGMGLTVEEVAAVLDCDKKTLERRFVAEIKGGRTNLNASLKRKQFSVAMKGNVAMLIWLGKQYLGQTDKVEHDINDDREEKLLRALAASATRYEEEHPGNRGGNGQVPERAGAVQ